MHHLEISSVSVELNNQLILDNLSMSVETGEILCLLGTSGEGKTTLLRTIAGFIQPQSGSINMLNQPVANKSLNVPVEKRQLGMVFQDFALFPHISVSDNIAFGIQSLDALSRQQRINELADLLNMHAFINKYPHQLSGGQQQRVAIARAMAPRPNILLLDEPFSSLDLEMREHLARELRQVLKHTGVTAIMVCHNQLEAFALADKIGVLNKGKIEQLDQAFNLYHRPETRFVADFVGEGMFIQGEVYDKQSIETALGLIQGNTEHGFDNGKRVQVLIRPDDILHDDDSDLKAIVMDKLFRGAEFLYTLKLDNDEEVLSLVPSHHDHQLNEAIGVRLEIDHLVAFDNNSA